MTMDNIKSFAEYRSFPGEYNDFPEEQDFHAALAYEDLMDGLDEAMNPLPL